MAFVRSVPHSIAFYRKLGFTEGDTQTPPGGVEAVWAWLHTDRAQLMLAQEEEPAGAGKRTVLFYLYCDDVQAFRRRLVEAGVEAGPVQHPFYAPRGEFRVTDPDGYVLMVSHT
jgi:uncharacterized glyoxalase superfamily protein PhnB